MYAFVKRLCDVAFGVFLLLIVCIPFTFVVILPFVYTGQVFFFQNRLGRNGRSFRIFKLRTFKNDNSIPPALNLLRKLKIDELPQVLNIIAGDMSFVGPRPLLIEYGEVLEAHSPLRSSVRPGLTGLAQLKGGNALSWKYRLELDSVYAQKQSLSLDLFILLKTPLALWRNWGSSVSTSLLDEPWINKS